MTGGTNHLSDGQFAGVTDRVTPSEDGIYRWIYDYDMWHNGVIFRSMMKIGLWIAVPMGLFAAALGEWGGVNGWLMGLSIMAGFLLVMALSYAIWALVRKGVYRMQFMMDDEAVAMVPTQAEKTGYSRLGLLVGILGLASGHALQAAGQAANLNAASRNSVVNFKSVRRISTDKRDGGQIYLREWIGGLQIFVGPGDYEFVLDYIRQRVPAQPDRSAARAARRKRMMLAALGSLAVNLVTLAVNLRSYEQTGWLKWAYSYRGGDYGQQRAFALLVTDWYTPGMGDAGAVTHSMAFSLPYAVIGFLVVALALYLMLWLASLLTGGREKE